MNLNPSFMKEIFAERETHYNLGDRSNIYAHWPRITVHGFRNFEFAGEKHLTRFTIAYKKIPIYRVL